VRTDRWEVPRAPGGSGPASSEPGREVNCSAPGVTFVHTSGNDSPRRRLAGDAFAAEAILRLLGGVRLPIASCPICPSWHGRCTIGGRTSRSKLLKSPLSSRKCQRRNRRAPTAIGTLRFRSHQRPRSPSSRALAQNRFAGSSPRRRDAKTQERVLSKSNIPWSSDSELVAQILSGNRDAFEMLYEAYLPARLPIRAEAPARHRRG
jgi:hypothetical protein